MALSSIIKPVIDPVLQTVIAGGVGGRGWNPGDLENATAIQWLEKIEYAPDLVNGSPALQTRNVANVNKPLVSVPVVTFDGVPEKIEVLDHVRLQNIWDGGGTFVCRVKINGPGGAGSGRIIGKNRWWIDYTNVLRLNQTFSGGIAEWWVTLPSSSTWTSIAIVYNSDSATNDPLIYADGVLLSVSSAQSTGTRVSDVGDDLYIGNDVFESRNLDGDVSDALLYDRALTVAEVQYLYSEGTSGTDPTNANLMARWPVQEGAGKTSYDVTGNGHHGRHLGGVSWNILTNLVKDHSVDYGGLSPAYGIFKDATDYLQVPNDAVLENIWDGGGTLTVSIFKEGSGGANSGRIFGKETWYIDHTNVLRLVYGFSGSGGEFWAVPGLSNDKWYNIAIVYDADSASNLPTFYLNGVEVGKNQASPTGTRNDDSANDLFIGNSISLARHFDGLISNVRCYDRALTSQEVVDIHNNVPVSGAVGEWRIHGDFKDTSGNGNDGTAAGVAFDSTFVPGLLQGSGTPMGPKSHLSGKLGNTNSQVNFNPLSDVALTAVGAETAWPVGTDRQSTVTVDTKFARNSADGSDRLVTTDSALTGDDKTNMEGYVEPS